MIEKLKKNSIICCGTVIGKKEAFIEYGIDILDKIPSNKNFKAIIIAVAHKQFKLLEDYEKKQKLQQQTHQKNSEAEFVKLY